MAVKDKDYLYDKHEELVKRCSHYSVKQAHISEDVRLAVRKEDFRPIGAQLDHFKLTASNFHKPIQLMLQAEEYHQTVQLRKLDRTRLVVGYHGRTKKDAHLWKYELYGFTEAGSPVMAGDFVVLERRDGQYFVLVIHEIDRNTIIFKELKGEPVDRELTDCTFNISLVPSRDTFEKMYDALEIMSNSKLDTRILFEHPEDQQTKPAKIDVESTTTERLQERLLMCNDSQRQAIVGMLEAKCRPKPFILFGPPGTGKTFTVVEAVVQKYQRNPSGRLLVCANSNNCADQLAAAIVKTELCKSLIRLCAKGHYKQLKKQKNRQSYHIKMKQLLKTGESSFRVIVTTNNMSSRLSRQSYDDVIIDEAGHAHIPETFTPASRLAPDGCLVLAGDPKQLGPVIKCWAIEQLGFGESVLEKLFKLPVYSFKPENGGYDSKFIVQLTICYRCDPRILAPCNELFYNGQLTCKGRTPPGLLDLFDVGHPLVFHEVRGTDERAESKSLYNETEANMCLDIMDKCLRFGIRPDEIGIISHYKEQVKLLSKLMRFRPHIVGPDRDKIAGLSAISGLMERLNLDDSSSDTSSLSSAGNETDNKTDRNAGESTHGDTDDEPAETATFRGQQGNRNVSPGQAQVKNRHEERCKVDTVDGFQGKEKEVIIVSTVKCQAPWGFVENSKRFNVAISRAKWMVIVVGHPNVLRCHKNWPTFKSHASISQH